MSRISFFSRVAIKIVCVTLVVAPTTVAVAQTDTVRTEQVKALAATLLQIGNAIRTATNLTETERIILYTQLAPLSNSVAALNSTSVNSAMTPRSRATGKEIGLERVILSYNYRRPSEVTAIARFATSTPQNFSFSYPALLNYQTFSSRMTAARQFAANDIAQKIDMLRQDIGRLTFISTSNPARGDFSQINSPIAYELEEDFGKYSIINDVRIYPGNGKAKIEIKSDQAEVYIIEIIRDPNGRSSGGSKYSYKQTFKIIQGLNNFSNLRDEDSEIVTDHTFDNLDKKELTDLLLDLLGNHSSMTEIENFEEKLFEFIIENKTFLLAGGMARDMSEYRNCYDPGDVTVMKGLATSILRTMELQAEPVDDALLLQAPIQDSIGGWYKRCVSVKKYF